MRLLRRGRRSVGKTKANIESCVAEDKPTGLDVKLSHDATCVPSTSTDNDGHSERSSTIVPGEPTDDGHHSTELQGPAGPHPSILGSRGHPSQRDP
ncbi:hypothetical protein ANANG_G00155140 [Anguilla anguilla]|uniref:Uncharacterized protein n=1 Tax=Anguilla anguilla TaxID=7936 RepID=A0A9D3RUR3_ANGAN|nr:hypothetical protein ANANG_G00155140 [Anguilla anguilla]